MGQSVQNASRHTPNASIGASPRQGEISVALDQNRGPQSLTDRVWRYYDLEQLSSPEIKARLLGTLAILGTALLAGLPLLGIFIFEFVKGKVSERGLQVVQCTEEEGSPSLSPAEQPAEGRIVVQGTQTYHDAEGEDGCISKNPVAGADLRENLQAESLDIAGVAPQNLHGEREMVLLMEQFAEQAIAKGTSSREFCVELCGMLLKAANSYQLEIKTWVRDRSTFQGLSQHNQNIILFLSKLVGKDHNDKQKEYGRLMRFLNEEPKRQGERRGLYFIGHQFTRFLSDFQICETTFLTKLIEDIKKHLHNQIDYNLDMLCLDIERKSLLLVQQFTVQAKRKGTSSQKFRYKLMDVLLKGAKLYAPQLKEWGNDPLKFQALSGHDREIVRFLLSLVGKNRKEKCHWLMNFLYRGLKGTRIKDPGLDCISHQFARLLSAFHRCTTPFLIDYVEDIEMVIQVRINKNNKKMCSQSKSHVKKLSKEENRKLDNKLRNLRKRAIDKE